MGQSLSYGKVVERYLRARSILHVPHASADADAFGSAYAAWRGFGGTLFLDEDAKRSAQNLAEHLGVQPARDVDVEAHDLVVVYDTPSSTQLPLVLGRDFLAVDHHDESPLSREARWRLHRPAQACCLVVERLLALAGKALDAPMATALAAGVLGDTRYLAIATPATLRRFARLLEAAEVNVHRLQYALEGTGTVRELEALLDTFRSVQIRKEAGLTVALAQPTDHVQAFRLARSLGGRGADLILALVPEHRGTCLRILTASRHFWSRMRPSDLARALSREIEGYDVWPGGVHTTWTVNRVGCFLQEHLARYLETRPDPQLHHSSSGLPGRLPT